MYKHQATLDRYLVEMIRKTAFRDVLRPKQEEVDQIVTLIQQIIRPVWNPDDLPECVKGFETTRLRV